MKKFIFLLILIFNLNPCFAINEIKKISLADAIYSALETNPQIKIAKLQTQEAKNDIKIAMGFKNPSISTFHNIGSTATGNPQQIGLEYELDVLKRGKKKKLAQSNYNAVFNNEKFLEFNLIFEIKKSYIDFLLKKSNLKILKEQKELSYELLCNAQNDFKKGLMPSSEVIQAKIAYNRALMAQNNAQSELIFSQNRFNTAMNASNIDYDTQEDFLSNNYSNFLTINPKNQLISFEKIKNYALLNRHDLLSSAQEVISAQNNLSVVKSKLIPNIELIGGYAYQPKGSSDINLFQQGAYAGANIVNIPVFYQYKPEIQNAQIEIERAKLKYQDNVIDITRNITDAWEKFVIARDNLNFYNDELLINSSELLEASKKSLEKKEIDITDFLVSKRLYLELMLGYQEALAQYYINYADLLKEMNAIDLDVIENI